MFASTPAIMALFAGLGLVALALGLLARRYSATALGAGLSGMLALTAASTWIATSAPITKPDEIERLKRDVGGERAKSTDLGRQLQDLGGQLSAAKQQTTVALAESERQWLLASQARADTEAVRREADEARTRAESAEAAAARAIAERDEERRKRDAAEVRAKELEALVSKLTARVRELEGIPAPLPPRTNTDLVELRSKFETGVSERTFAIQPLDRQDLVFDATGNWSGRWYRIQLMPDGKRLQFPDREFRMRSANREIMASLAAVTKTLQPLLDDPPIGSARVFVRGWADDRPVTAASDLRIDVMPRRSDGRYDARTKRDSASIRIDNPHLPSFRADWLREQLRLAHPALKQADIEILGNPPTGNERTVEIILFVKWP